MSDSTKNRASSLMARLTASLPTADAPLEALFDAPCPDPPQAPPPYGGGAPYQTGQIPSSLRGREVWRLVAALSGLEEVPARRLTEFGCLWLDARPAFEPDRLLGSGVFRLNYPAYGPVQFYQADPARVVFEDDQLLVYDKESGRPAQGVPHDAFNNALAALERRAGLTLRLPHRLDAPTSGLMLLAKDRETAGRLGRAFQNGRIVKRYLALGQAPGPAWDEKCSTAFIAKEAARYEARAQGPGLAARTDLTVLARRAEGTLFLAEPRTGRTHQIRLHLAFEGWPIAGDRFYGGEPAARLMLRASGLAFRHPGDGRLVALGGPWAEGEPRLD
ncbi:MAG: RluA family pseudouridine synthase [Deltaproteobacteria bacterium]|jgi:23S rRNA pseudouridine1911/1915/1917 synthase|nr:RluA family pseudouridine synthase [Deltaproteobacteria bacterium]